jgi:riboflavin biosynthesis pyrimidine reductase
MVSPVVVRLASLLGAEPLELLYESSELAQTSLPAELRRAYGGELGFAEGRVFANFVMSADGVVALDSPQESGGLISRGCEADRFVMGLLRSFADTILIGAETYRKAGRTRFDARTIFPDGADDFEALRASLGSAKTPNLAIITGSGLIDTNDPALEDAIIFTTPRGEAALRRRLPSSTRLVATSTEELEPSGVIAWLKQHGSRLILTEGGPSLLGELFADGLVDELFVTTSPLLFGRFERDHRKSLTAGTDLGGLSLELMSLRRHGSYLFSRYRTVR